MGMGTFSSAREGRLRIARARAITSIACRTDMGLLFGVEVDKANDVKAKQEKSWRGLEAI